MTWMKGQNVLPFCKEEMGKGISRWTRLLDEDGGGSHRGGERFFKGRVRVREVRIQGGRDE